MTARHAGPARRIILATNREGLGLGAARGETLRYAALDIAVPTDRAPGTLPIGPDGFALAGTEGLDGTGLDAELRHSGEPTLWIHGYNNTPAEAVYRHAQLATDLDLMGPQISFVWPSGASYGGYVQDRDSALHARGAGEQLVREIAARAGRPSIVLAHSMGAFLIMEALRSARLRGAPLNAALGGVVLIQPDIDVDVFVSQARDAAPLPPTAVIIRRDDAVLRASARLSGRPDRLGSTGDLAAIKALGIRILDLTGLEDASVDHLSVLTSPSALELIRSIRLADG
ncbi:alpha/beta hydrolase [Jannaschia donghaensis]|uniref:alpha/beta hydrolase n=1 Tax=Jannaschia donghaensis TaxID=420998 RepID=UPI0006D78257|nr:alpha/beta hydrolase [Jannaschia donghaensis]